MVDWKKEIKLSDLVRRRPAAEPPVRDSGPGEGAPGEPGVSPAAEAAAQPEEREPAEKTPIWKKEISLRRKPKKPKEPKEPKAKLALPEEEGEKTSIWKKEISFGRKRGDTAPEPVETPAPVLAAPVAVGPQPELVLVPEPEPVAIEPEPVAAAQPVEPVAQPVEPVAPSVEPQSAPTFSPPAPPPAPPPGVHPPVPASELPPLPQPEVEEAEKKSFLKREISFGRKPKAEAEPNAKGSPTRRELRLPSLPSLRRERSGGAQGRRRRLVGLKLGASQLAAARVNNNNGVPELLQVARAPLERGIIVSGELRDPETLAVALRGFFRKHKLPKRNVRLGIANNRIGVRILEISGIDDPRQLGNAIRYRAGEALPIPIEEAVLDYQILSERVDEEGVRTHRVLLVVTYRELIDRYVTACRKAGVKLVGIDLEAFALLRALAAPRPETAAAGDTALVCISIGHDRSTFAVSDGRICEFTRVLDWGGQALNVAIARALDLTPSEAEPIKHALSLAGPQELPGGLTEEQVGLALEAVRRQLQTFARELVSSLQFYQNQPGSLGIGEIVLTGGTVHLPGLAEELQRLIGVTVRIGDPLVRVKAGRRLKDTDQLGSLAVAIGLGIED